MKPINLYLILIFVAAGLIQSCTSRTHAHSDSVKLNNGITIAYETFGDSKNEAILLIQGSGATLLHYPEELCNKLANADFYVIRFDNRDIGLSSHLDTLGAPNWESILPYFGTCNQAPLPYTLKDMSDDVLPLLNALKVPKAHIVGTSMGGVIAQTFTIHHQEHVRSISCISSTTGNLALFNPLSSALSSMPAPPTSDNIDSISDYLVNTYKALGATDTDEALKTRALAHINNRDWSQAGADRQAAVALIEDNCDRRQLLENINKPTVIIHGNSDPLVDINAGRELYETIPNAQMYEIKRMGHVISLEFVNEIANAIIMNARRTNIENQ